jgi:hypothetical protein
MEAARFRLEVLVGTRQPVELLGDPDLEVLDLLDVVPAHSARERLVTDVDRCQTE